MVEFSNASGGTNTLEVSSPFTRWFDVNGFFVARPFQQWLASEIPLIGQVDPKNQGGSTKAAANTNRVSKDTGPMEREKNNTLIKSTSSDASITNTRSRRGKEG